ncbi:V-type proton ATPase catalytic subunit A [Linum perenne]
MAALLQSFLISSLTQLAITTLLPFFYSSCCSRNRIVPHYPNFFFPSSTTAAVQQKSIQQTWPIRTPRPVASKLAADTPLLTGQVRYFLFLCVDCSSRVQSSAHYPKARGDDVENEAN